MKLAFYAIYKGREGFTGVVTTWWGYRGARWYVNGVSGARCKKFPSRWAATVYYTQLAYQEAGFSAAAASAAAANHSADNSQGGAAAAAGAAASEKHQPARAARAAPRVQVQEQQGGVGAESDICRALRSALATVIRSRQGGGGAGDNTGWTFNQVVTIFGVTETGSPELYREVVEAFFGDIQQ